MILDKESPATPPSAMSVGIKYGLFMALASIAIFVIRVVISGNPFDRSWPWTVVTIAVSVAIFVLAQREYKVNGDGFMSYGKGFMIGLWVSVISLLAYLVFMLLYTNVIDTELMNTFIDTQREQMESQGNMTDAQIETAIGFTRKLFWPFFLIFGMFFSIIEVLVVTIFTQRANPNPLM